MRSCATHLVLLVKHPSSDNQLAPFSGTWPNSVGRLSGMYREIRPQGVNCEPAHSNRIMQKSCNPCTDFAALQESVSAQDRGARTCSNAKSAGVKNGRRRRAPAPMAMLVAPGAGQPARAQVDRRRTLRAGTSDCSVTAFNSSFKRARSFPILSCSSSSAALGSIDFSWSSSSCRSRRCNSPNCSSIKRRWASVRDETSSTAEP